MTIDLIIQGVMSWIEVVHRVVRQPLVRDGKPHSSASIIAPQHLSLYRLGLQIAYLDGFFKGLSMVDLFHAFDFIATLRVRLDLARKALSQ